MAQKSVCPFYISFATTLLPQCRGRSYRDTRMLDMYVAYSEIEEAADGPLCYIKARHGALSDYADSQGLTGQAAFDGLRRLKDELQGELRDPRWFFLFYCFVFFMCRGRGQKSISVNIAVDAWRLTLSGRFRLLDQWCAYVQVHQRHSISEDTWRQVLEFSMSVHEDLSDYDPGGAWPVLIDDFVDNVHRKAACAICSLNFNSTVVCHGLDPISKPSSDGRPSAEALSSKATALPGMVSLAGSKRRRCMVLKDDAAQVQPVEPIIQDFAKRYRPISCKQV